MHCKNKEHLISQAVIYKIISMGAVKLVIITQIYLEQNLQIPSFRKAEIETTNSVFLQTNKKLFD